MKVAVIGSNGMLGHDLMSACEKAGIDVKGYDLPEVDITRDDGGLENVASCDWVINCAAYTDVDGAEKEQAMAFAVNGDGVRRLVSFCKKRNTPLLHMSTDYLFDGMAKSAYREDSPVNPLSVYGRSKLAGEKAVLAGGLNKYLIVRTQSLFGVNGRNFVKAIMARLEAGNEPLKVVSDQTSSPTYTVHLADAILRLMSCKKQGIVNASASGECSWCEFACAIAGQVKPGAVVMPVTTSEYPRAARRPAYSVLDKGLYEAWTGSRMPSWEEGLREYLGECNRPRSRARPVPP